MKFAPIPDNETARLQALAACNLLDTPPEPEFDDITRNTSEICGTPIALISLLDENREYFKSRQGLRAEEAPRKYSFCAHTILHPSDVMIVPDTRYDERFYDNPLTTGEFNFIFYAGVPIVDDQGYALGALAVADRRPRELPEEKLLSLKALAQLVATQIELRKTKMNLENCRNG